MGRIRIVFGKIGRSDMVDSSGARSAAAAGRERLGIWKGTSSRRRTTPHRTYRARGDSFRNSVPRRSRKTASRMDEVTHRR